MGSSGGGMGGRVPIAGQSPLAGQSPVGGAGNNYEGPGGTGGWFDAGAGGGGDVGAMRQQLAAITGGGGGFGGGRFPYGNPGNPPPPQAPAPAPMLARPAASGAGGGTREGLAPPGPAGQMNYTGTGTGDWNYATQVNGSTNPYNYAGFNVSHGVGDDPAKGQVSAISMPGQVGYLARPAGAQGGFLPRPR